MKRPIPSLPRYSGSMHVARRLRALLLATVLVGVMLALAPTAVACVLQMTLDRPSYAPGSPAVITGYASGPQSETATRVTLTWGDGGPLLGEASIAPDQSFSFSFTVAADMRPGNHAIYARAFNGAGEMISPLPGSVLLTVNAPANPGAKPTETPAATPQPKPVEAKAEPRATSKDAPAPQSQPAPAAPQAAPAAVATPATVPEERTTSTPVPAPAAVRARLTPRTVAPPVARVQEPSPASQLEASPLVESTEERTAPAAGDSSSTALVLLLALAVLALALGGVAARLVLTRRTSDARRSSSAPTATADASDAVEAELQEMIAEERARAQRITERP